MTYPSRSVFLFSYTGSGGLTLQAALNAQPGICLRGARAGMLQQMAASWHSLTSIDAMKGVRKAGIETDQTHPWYGAEKADPDIYGRHLAQIYIREALTPPPATPMIGQRITGMHRALPQFRTQLAFLTRFFPDPRFLFLTRPAEALAKTDWWQARPEEELTLRLPAYEKRVDTFVARHPGSARKLDYLGAEDPEATLQDILHFLDSEESAA